MDRADVGRVVHLDTSDRQVELVQERTVRTWHPPGDQVTRVAVAGRENCSESSTPALVAGAMLSTIVDGSPTSSTRSQPTAVPTVVNSAW